MDFIAPGVERREPLQVGDERTMLESFIDFHRDTLLWKCAGLTGAQLKQAPIEPSTLRLIGLVRHLSDVEYWWFGQALHGKSDLPYYGTEDDTRVDIREAGGADPAEAFERYRAAVAHARETAAAYDLDHTVEGGDGNPATLRWIYLHMLEEYARHNGHADLIRERIDGTTGE